MGKVNTLKAFIGFVWAKWPPGICISVLALAAAIFPITTPSELTAIDKAKWIAGFGFLLVLELVIIFKERRAQDRSYIEQMTRLDGLRQASEAHNTAVMRQFMAMNDPVDSLKKRALDLSELILDFIYARIQRKPEEPLGYPYIMLEEDLHTYLQKSNERSAAQFRSFNYSEETRKLYLRRFQDKAVAIRDEFARHNLISEGLNSALDSASRGLVGDDLIRFIGEQIGNLAEKCNTKTPDT